MDNGLIHRLRIILLEPNRYLALLMEREIVRAYRSAVIARFDNSQAALEEIGRTRYDVAVVDLEGSIKCQPNLLADIRRVSPRVVLVGVAPQHLIDEEPDNSLAPADKLMPKDDQTSSALPGVIEELSCLWQQVEGDDDSAGVVGGEARAAVIKLTVRTLAHEINNPLMTIMGTTELLLDSRGEVPADQREKIRMIQDSARRIQSTLAELVGDDYSGIRRTPVGLMLKSRKRPETVR